MTLRWTGNRLVSALDRSDHTECAFQNALKKTLGFTSLPLEPETLNSTKPQGTHLYSWSVLLSPTSCFWLSDASIKILWIWKNWGASRNSQLFRSYSTLNWIEVSSKIRSQEVVERNCRGLNWQKSVRLCPIHEGEDRATWDCISISLQQKQEESSKEKLGGFIWRVVWWSTYVHHKSRFHLHPLTSLHVSIWSAASKCSSIPCKFCFGSLLLIDG